MFNTNLLADGWTSAFVLSGEMCSLQYLHRTWHYIQICKQDIVAWQEVDSLLAFQDLLNFLADEPWRDGGVNFVTQNTPRNAMVLN